MGKPEEPKGDESGQWKLECLGQSLLSQPSWAADLPAASDILRLELHSRGGSSCALPTGLWKGKGPGECRFGAEFQKGGRKENGQKKKNNKSWYGCYLSSLGIKGDVKGRSKKPPLLLWGEGAGRKSPPEKIPARICPRRESAAAHWWRGPWLITPWAQTKG